ncbi:MAG: transcriptional regulator [Firmicutes bacterium]|nr:transcriptional regulator [Bacillota bacterium]
MKGAISVKKNGFVDATTDGKKDVTRSLLSALYSGGLQTLADVVYSIMENPIIISDSSFKLLATSKKGIKEIDYYSCYMNNDYMDEASILDIRRLKTIQRLNTTRLAYIEDSIQDKPRLITAPVIVNDIMVGFVTLVELFVPFKENDLDVMNQVSMAIAIELQKAELYQNNSGLQHEYFLLDLLDGTLSNAALIESRSKALNVRLNPNKRIVVMEFTKQFLVVKQLKTLAHEVKNVMRWEFVLVYENRIVALTSHREDEIWSQENKVKLDEFLTTNKLVAGVSKSFQYLGNISKYYNGALDSIAVAKYLGLEETIFFFEDLFVYHILKLCSKNVDLENYILDQLKLLIQYDRENNTELMDTLYCYLLNMKHTVKTSQDLHIHRNTLFYRLNKIQELTYINFEDGEICFKIVLSFKLLEYLSHAVK